MTACPGPRHTGPLDARVNHEDVAGVPDRNLLKQVRAEVRTVWWGSRASGDLGLAGPTTEEIDRWRSQLKRWRTSPDWRGSS
jgi:hypothetical protein